MNTPRFTFSLLPRCFPLVLLGAALALAQPCLATPFTFDNTGSMNVPRFAHTSTLLQNGKVLVAGGGGANGTSAELYDPASGTWTVTGSLNRGRSYHTATLLLDGKVLVAGGGASAELYDPASGTWTVTGSLTGSRLHHTAALLPNGKVLVAGGSNSDGYLASAEVYDPATQTWTATASLSVRRIGHTMTLLPNGKVLVAGGYHDLDQTYLASCELYDPSKGTWASTGSLVSGREHHTATLLPDGKVLMAGGEVDFNYLASAQLYDPATGQWTNTGSLKAARDEHTATLLPDGKVLVIGGSGSSAPVGCELYDPSTQMWTTTDSTAIARSGHTVTLLPNGKVLVAGGVGSENNTFTIQSSAELYDPSDGAWLGTGTTAVARALHTATLLRSGEVLVAGGKDSSTTLAFAELYNPSSSTWTNTSTLNGARSRHTATLLPSGKVLVAGGVTGTALATAELYDRSNATWTNTGNLNTSRYEHTATLLPNGKVLVTGGTRVGGFPSGTIYIATAELYDPGSGTWAFTGSMATGRHNHTATLLPNGKVLVAGGSNGNNFLATCELYDPSTGAWSATGSMANPRELHTATLLPREQVLVAGGSNDGNAQGVVLASVEIYNPSTGAWVTVPSLNTARVGHSATLLPDGRVLVDGGLGDGGTYPAGSELYDPAIVKWTPTGSVARSRHTATLLPNGRVLAVGGYFANNTPQTYSSSYDAGLAFLRPTWQPQISSAFLDSLNDGRHLFLTGSRFLGLSEASGGTTQNSATNYPVVQVRSIDNSQVVFLPSDPAFGLSDDLFFSTPLSSFPSGPALVTVFANGIPSDASYLLIDPPATSTPTPTPTPTATPGLVANVATRLPVGTGENVLIEGFTVQGPGGSTKKIIVRAIGPSLAPFGVPDALANPTLEIHDASANNATVATNNDWKTTQVGGLITGDQSAEIAASGVAPSNDLESAIIANLAPGSYTAVVQGAGNTVGTGLVDAYDLSAASPARLANIATRGLIQPGDKLMIAGFIIQNGPVRAVVRAIGPSLSAFGISNALPDTTLQLRDSNGAIVRENDDWQTDQQQELINSGLQPSDDREAALVETLQPGQYTAQVRGKPEQTGIGVVQVYFLQ